MLITDTSDFFLRFTATFASWIFIMVIFKKFFDYIFDR